MMEFPTCLIAYSPSSQTRRERSRLMAELIDSSNALSARDIAGTVVLIKTDFSLTRTGEWRVNPETLWAVADYFLAHGARVLVGDSPLDACLGDCGAGARHRLSRQMGDLGVEWVSFEESGTTAYTAERRVLFIANPAISADLVIGIAAYRNDRLCQPYGAMANLVGLLPGFQKAGCLLNEPGPFSFPNLAVDMLAAVGPALSILTVPARDGNHSSGEMIGVSSDTVALDASFAQAVSRGYKEPSPLVQLAADAGLGIGWPEAITVRQAADFPHDLEFIPEEADSRITRWPTAAVSLLSPFTWPRPQMRIANCRPDCVECTGKCPTSAFELVESDRSVRFHPDRCVYCWRCREVCPSHAIGIERPSLLDCMLA